MLTILVNSTGLYFSETHEKGYCSFPEFLWAPLPDGSNRKWFTRTEYVRNSNVWERQRQIIVEETEMTVHHRIQMSCQKQGRHSDRPCFANDIHFSIICVAEEPGDKFRVQQTVDG